MNVILMDRIRNLGELGDRVEVKPGYGRNYLIPQGKAVPATPDNVKYFEARRAELEKAAKERLGVDQARADKVNGMNLTISARVGEEGKLYGSVSTNEIIDAIKAAGGDISKQEIQMPEGQIRQVGDYEIKLSLHHGDVTATVNISVVAEA